MYFIKLRATLLAALKNGLDSPFSKFIVAVYAVL